MTTSTLETGPAFLSIEDLGRLLRKKKLSPVDLVEEQIARIARLNPKLNAFITVSEAKAREQARIAEKEISRGRSRGPLHGIPITLKDNIATQSVRTTAGSKFFCLPDSAPAATVAQRLDRAGAVLLGKTNLHEFAYGITSENPHFGPVHNPWDLDRIPGGSTGGSAAALAVGIGYGSIGSDTGGSLRVPSAFCGVTGLKPTFGRVSCFGIVPLAQSLDHAGPMARTVGDAAILLQTIAGYDPQDPVSVRKPVPNYLHGLRGKIKKFKLGWPRDFFFDDIDPEVRRCVDSAAKVFESLGAEIFQISLPHLAESSRPAMLIALVEALRYHQNQGFFPAKAEEYGEDLRNRLQASFDVKAVDYLAANELRQKITREFDLAFEEIDAILAPTVPVTAPRIGEKMVTIEGKEEAIRSALVRLNRPANYTGHPAISVPCGFSEAGLPIGLELIGRKWDEAQLLQIAFAYEQATEWHNHHPPISA